MWPLVYVVENRMLRTDAGLPAHPNIRGVQLDFNHVSGAHAPAFGHAVDERFVQIQYECLLRHTFSGLQINVRRLPPRDERSRGRRCSRVPRQRTSGGRRRFEMGRDVLLLGTAARAPSRGARRALFMLALPKRLVAV